MGFFDYLMKGIGFETDENSSPKRGRIVENKKNATQEEMPASFDLPIFNAKEQKQEEEISQKIGTTNVIVYNPKNQADIKNLIDFLRRKEPIIVNFDLIPQNVSESMISFISGALYALRGSIHPIAKDLYLLTPEGVNILTPKE